MSKNNAEDRPIFDRPENGCMPSLDCARLPSASCFTRLLLGENQVLRGSGRIGSSSKFNAVGGRVPNHVVRRHGHDPEFPHRDRNGCAIAQATHERPFLESGAKMVYGEPSPG